MLRNFFQNITKPYVSSGNKVKNRVLLLLLTLCFFGGIFGLNQMNTYGQTIRASKGNSIVPGTTSGKLTLHIYIN